MKLKVTLDDSRIQKLIKKIGDKNVWMSILKSLGATIVFADIQKHFRDKKGPNTAWAKRDDKTQERYGKIGSGQWKAPRGTSPAAFNPSNALLEMTGTLRGGFLPTNIRQKSNSIELFNPVEYAAVHDEGSKKQGIPQREFMWLSEGGNDILSREFVTLVTREAEK